MYFFNCGCGTTRPKNPDETIYTLYLLVKEGSDEDRMLVDIHIPYPWCHLIQHIEVVSPSYYVFSTTNLRPGGRERDVVRSRKRLPIGASFIAMCNEHSLFVRPI